MSEDSKSFLEELENDRRMAEEEKLKSELTVVETVEKIEMRLLRRRLEVCKINNDALQKTIERMAGEIDFYTKDSLIENKEFNPQFEARILNHYLDFDNKQRNGILKLMKYAFNLGVGRGYEMSQKIKGIEL